MDRTAPALAAAVVSGALVAVQARVNAGLAERLDDPLLAAVLSFATGLVVVVAVVLARPTARNRAASQDSGDAASHTPTIASVTASGLKL